MNALDMWNALIVKAKEFEFEIHTIPQNRRSPLWFLVGSEGDIFLIKKAISNRPSVKLSQDRRITFKDFELVFGYYDLWLKGHTGTRHEVSRLSRNTAYIFALIAEAKSKDNL